MLDCMKWGMTHEFLMQLPVTCLESLVADMEAIKDLEIQEQSWFDMVTAQGAPKDLEKLIKKRQQKHATKKEAPKGLGSLKAQMGVAKAPKRKK